MMKKKGMKNRGQNDAVQRFIFDSTAFFEYLQGGITFGECMTKAASFLIIALVVTSCSDSGTEPPLQPGAGGQPDSGSVSFTNDVLPTLSTGCSLGGCHRPPSPSSGFDQSTYAGVRAGGMKFGVAVIIAGDSASSRIIQAMRGTAPGLGRMPFGGPWAASGVPDSLVTKIAVWIQEGALNN